MDFKVWKASARIKDYLKVFFSGLLKRKLGKNICYGPEVLAEAHHQMLCTKTSLLSTAQRMELAYATLTRKLERVNGDDVWKALSSVMEDMLKVKENLLIADFILLSTQGKSYSA